MAEEPKPANKCIDPAKIVEIASNNTDLIDRAIDGAGLYLAYRTYRHLEDKG